MNGMQPMYPLMNPFQVGYPSMQMQPQMPVQQQQRQQQGNMYAVGVPIANGIAEVQRTITPPGTKTMFVDAMQPLLYVRTVDSTGNNAEVETYKLTPAEQENQASQNYVTVEQMQEALRNLEEKYAKHEPVVSEPTSAATATAAIDESVITRHATPVNATIIEPAPTIATPTTTASEYAGSIVASRNGQ